MRAPRRHKGFTLRQARIGGAIALAVTLAALFSVLPRAAATTCDPSESLYARLERHEGRRACVYTDSLGNLTIGIGHLLRRPADPGLCWTDERVNDVFAADVRAARRYARADMGAGWDVLSPVRRDVLTELAFQLGGRGLESFHKARRALLEKDYDLAARELLNSRLARQTPSRTRTLACLMRHG